MAEHVIGREAPTHTSWDASLEPALRVRPGDVVHLETDDFAGGQIRRDSVAEDLLALDFERIYPLAGPVWVDGAEPGDALRVEVLGFEPAEWGWACVIPASASCRPGTSPSPT